MALLHVQSASVLYFLLSRALMAGLLIVGEADESPTNPAPEYNLLRKATRKWTGIWWCFQVSEGVGICRFKASTGEG